jgi:hypothetical protein
VVEETGDGRLRPLSRYYMPDPQNPEAMVRAGSVLKDIGTTVAWNLAREETGESRFEGRATESGIPERHAGAFAEFLETEGQSFLERIDAWLSRHQAEDDEKTAGARMGVGVYMIRDDDKGRGKGK